MRDISETYLALNFKMDARNLAIVFGPTLIKKKDDDMTSIVRDMSDQCRIIESVILHVSSCNKRNFLVKLVRKLSFVSAVAIRDKVLWNHHCGVPIFVA